MIQPAPEKRLCSRCGTENGTEQNFCSACGTRLAVTCTRCGAGCQPGFKFCGSCGAQLEDPAQPRPPRDERRVVTILFADLVGFTSWAEGLDPEDVKAMLSPYYASLREQIESCGGTVEKFIGDAVVGVFGAPVAHGDDAERAVRAALGIRDRVTKMTAAGSGGNLEVRIGVNTGEAFVALDARPEEGEGMVAGDVVNTAARLQSAAPTNEILVGEETYRCTCMTLDYSPHDALALKGKELPVAAWRVRGAPRAPGERMASVVQMIGRERELELLTDAWERVLAEQRPRLVTIFGLPGVGKSRLAAEFMATVRSTGARVIFGRSLPYGESGVYDAFGQQLREVASVMSADSPPVVAEKLRGTIGGLLAGESPDALMAHVAMMLGLRPSAATDDQPVGNRRDLFFSARCIVKALAAAQPTVLVFQDLHWADPSLLDLIETLCRRIEDAPLMVLTAARPELQTKRPAWGAGAEGRLEIALDPLSADDSCELASRLLAHAAETQVGQTAQEISTASEGNPLFIEELVASLADGPVPAGAQLPTSIRGIIAARLDAIPTPERSALLNASVVGRVFWDGALARLTSPPGGVAELLESLEARDLVRREPASRFRGQAQYRFKHAMIRDVAYAALPRSTRRDAHAAIAGFLEEQHVEHDSAAALAHHWLNAGNRERAAGYFVAAADQASRGWAKEEAAGLYRQALRLVSEDDRQRRRTLRLKLAVAGQMAYHLSDAGSATGGKNERPPDA